MLCASDVSEICHSGSIKFGKWPALMFLYEIDELSNVCSIINQVDNFLSFSRSAAWNLPSVLHMNQTLSQELFFFSKLKCSNTKSLHFPHYARMKICSGGYF